jgi:EAL domain-containing protein (putative c-di-GMP-specific phosphodiesterase class I)
MTAQSAITSTIYEAFVHCETKAYLLLEGAIAPSSDVQDWQATLANDFKRSASKRLQSTLRDGEYSVETPSFESLRGGVYRVLFDPLICTRGINAQLHALQRLPHSRHAPTLIYTPLRFVRSEKLKTSDKLLIAFDAIAISRLTGNSPRAGKIIYGSEYTTATGRGTYCFYQTEMNERMKTRSKLERDLQSALTNGEFELFYQPIVNLEDNKIKTFEALLRWRHPERGLVSPTEFIPIAEETGLIVPLGEWVLRQACAEAAKWPNDIGVAVNISSVQLTNKNLANAVIGAIASASIPAARLNLEITESVFLQNTPANLATLKRLHELGVQFSMDDFGTGYSSLGYLLSFPFSKIKIDRSFITDLPTKKESRAIIRAIIDLARSLKIRVIAEGVETAQQLEQLRRLGCTEIQGYLFSPPRPVAEIRQFFLPNRKGGQGVVSIESQVA